MEVWVKVVKAPTEDPEECVVCGKHYRDLYVQVCITVGDTYFETRSICCEKCWEGHA